MYPAIVKPKLYFLAPQLQCTVIFGCAPSLKGFFFFLFAFTLLFLFFYSFFCISLSSLLTTSSFASFFLHRSITDLHEPSCHRPIVTDPRSAADPCWPILASILCFWRLCLCFGVDFGLSFRLCLCFRFVFWAGFLFCAWVSVWVCVSSVGFGLSFVFWTWVLASLLCFGHGFQFGFVFRSDFSAFFFCCSSMVLMGTGYSGGVVAVQWFLWPWW